MDCLSRTVDWKMKMVECKKKGIEQTLLWVEQEMRTIYKIKFCMKQTK
jgi:hypothetical protein